jgi:hypothetical protein
MTLFSNSKIKVGKILFTWLRLLVWKSMKANLIIKKWFLLSAKCTCWQLEQISSFKFFWSDGKFLVSFRNLNSTNRWNLTAKTTGTLKIAALRCSWHVLWFRCQSSNLLAAFTSFLWSINSSNNPKTTSLLMKKITKQTLIKRKSSNKQSWRLTVLSS